MTEPTIYSQERYDAAFADIVATASAAPDACDSLVVNMSEWGIKSENHRSFDKDIHNAELKNKLAVMSGDKEGDGLGVLYDDSEFGWGSRYQRAHEQGAIALACSGLRLNAPCVIYPESPSSTGLLFRKAPLVYVSHTNGRTSYHETLEGGRVLEGYLNFSMDRVQVDPLSMDVQDKALQAYRAMMKEWGDNAADSSEGMGHWLGDADATQVAIFSKSRNGELVREHNEVCVNAKLEHVAGVLVDGLEQERDGSGELIMNGAEDSQWKDYLLGHKNFTERLALAFQDYDMVTAKFEEKGMTPSPVPTVVIYQPDAEKAEDRMVHFPPTEKNRQMVQDVLAQTQDKRIDGSNMGHVVGITPWTQFKEEQYNQSFADIVATASAAPEEGEVLAVHMWEWIIGSEGSKYYNISTHWKEIKTVFAVMANDEGAIYNDEEHGCGARNQVANGDGMLAMPCSAMFLQSPCKLYETCATDTGLLLRNAVPVLAKDRGVSSVYIEKNDNGIRELTYFEDKMRSGVGDPLDLNVQKAGMEQYKALAAFALKTYQDNNGKVANYNEVCVNAKLENVSGIVVDSVEKATGKASQAISLHANDDMWHSFLQEHNYMAKRIALAFDEYDMVAAKFEEKGITPNPVPTVVIYQPYAQKVEDRMVHFPPTEKNRQMVQDVLAQTQDKRIDGSNMVHAAGITL